MKTAQVLSGKTYLATRPRARPPRPRPLITFPAADTSFAYFLCAPAPAAQLPLQRPEYLYCEEDMSESDEPGRDRQW